MAYRLCLLLIGLVWTTWAQAGPKEEALAAYDQFFTLFTTGNQVQVAALFAPDALFYGTGSADVVTTPEGVTAYFAGALSGTRGEVKARRFENTALLLSDTVVAISGKWQSERTLDGKMVTAGPSRVTVVMQKRGERWLIVQFHNSPTPKPPASAAAVPLGRHPSAGSHASLVTLSREPIVGAAIQHHPRRSYQEVS